jgi:2-methylcitrate dehydratase PrpD
MADPLFEIARFASELRVADLADDTKRRAGALIADNVACTIGALATPEGRAFARALHGPRPYRVYETGDPFAGAHTDAYLANLVDYDDVYEGSGHIGCVIIPAALRLAVAAGARGEDALAALVAGLEIGCRLADASKPTEAARQQMWGIGSRMTPAAAAAAARALRLSPEQTAHAIALACATAPLASVRKTVYGNGGVTWVKNNMGIAASAAVSAALMAREGATGPLDILDADRGFGHMIGTDHWTPEVAAVGLGSSWYLDRLGFKAYPCCRHAHAVIDAAMAAQRELGAATHEIERIAVAGPVWIHHAPFDNATPENMHDAQYSLPFVLAVALLGVPPGLSWFAPAIYERAHVRALAARVETESHPASRARVTISTRTRSATIHVDAPKGSPTAPMSEDELRGKFESLVHAVAGRGAARRLYNDLMHLDRIPSVRRLVATLPSVKLRAHTASPARVARTRKTRSARRPRAGGSSGRRRRAASR